MLNLLIVESPAKSKTIKRILQKNSQDIWNVVASRGYIKNLPKEYGLKFGGDGEFDAQWVYEKGKKKFISDLKEKIDTYGEIYIATDDDIEGEKIAYDLVSELKIENRYKRVVFKSITQEDILLGIASPRELDSNKYEIACNRRYIDRDEGYGISEVLRFDFKKKGIGFPKNLGVGRAISPALHIIAENDALIKDFIPEDYVRIKIRYLKDNIAFEYLDSTRYLYNNRDDQIALGLFKRQVSKSSHTVVGFTPKQEEVLPPPPLYTATLQSSAFNIWGFSGKETMQLAQELYENGIITYHRTDSNEISDTAYNQTVDYLYEIMDEDDVYDAKRKYKKRELSENSHEAVRPSSIKKETAPENIRSYAIETFSFEMNNKHKFLYELIWYRTIAVQMASAIYDRSILKLDAGGNILELRSNVIATVDSQETDEPKKMLGWLKLKEGLLKKSTTIEGEEYKDREVVLPRLYEFDKVDVLEISEYSTKTQAPRRYGEGRFTTTIEKLGIARPSTLATIIPSLIDKGCIHKVQGVLHLKKLGEVADEWVSEHCEWLNSAKGVKEFDMLLNATDKSDKQEQNKILFEYHEKINILKEKINFKEKNEQVTEASQAQIKIAKKIAIKNKVVIPEEAYGDSKKMSLFIQEHIKNNNEEEKLYLGACPECKKGKIIENEKAFGCNQFFKGCKFTVWKNASISYLKKLSVNADDEYLKNIVKLYIEGSPLFNPNVKLSENKQGVYFLLEKKEKNWAIAIKFKINV